MAKPKRQTVRVVLEYKVDGGPDGEPRTTAKMERDVGLGFVEIINQRDYGVVVKLKSVEVVD